MYEDGRAENEMFLPLTVIFKSPFATHPGYLISKSKLSEPSVMVSFVFSSVE